jgi:hypothetical protein
MNLFDRYPLGGRTLLGRLRNLTGACRSGYGLSLQRLTGETSCAYCGLSLVDDYYHWLLMSIDHVVPVAEARRVGICSQFYEDAINLVLCCSGCNGFGNRYRCKAEISENWTLDEFVALRDKVFADRSESIATRREKEWTFFQAQPWVQSG